MIEREKDRERGEGEKEIIAPAKLKIALSSFRRCKWSCNVSQGEEGKEEKEKE